MHIGDQRILGEDEIVARRRRQQRRIIDKPSPPGPASGAK
jgi:hypothetical protein